jgi:GNAT superfamily N-acetyltransferase
VDHFTPAMMSPVDIRVRQPTDLEACVEALRRTHEANAYPLNWPADPHGWLTPPGLLQAWVAELPDGGLAGHVVLSRTAGRSQAELSRLFVTPAARRRSVATALVTHAVDWASRRGMDVTLTVVNEHRSSAIAFYEATGWRHTHDSTADWTAPDGTAVTLRHYVRSGR